MSGLEAKPPVSQARRLFPGASRRPYLNVGQRSLLASPVRKAIRGFLDRWERGEPDKTELFATLERARSRFARLIGAEPDEVAWIKNVTEGFNLFLGSLDWRPGDEVVFCPDLEHPANVLPWRNLAARRLARLVPIPADRGRVPTERIADAVGPATRAVTVSTVTFSPGFETDLGPLREACQAHGALLLLDAAQSVGTLRTDVGALGCDMLAVATQKGLLATYGAGFLFVRREIAEGLAPASLGRFGVSGPAAEDQVPETDLPGGGIAYAAGARRFELGNFNYLGGVAAEAGLGVLERFEAAAVDRHNRSLAARLAAGFLEAGLPVAGGPPGPHLGHIVSVGEAGAGSHDTVEDPRMNSLHRALVEARVEHSVRRGVLRFAVHLYNDESDVDRTLVATRRWLARGSSATV